MARFARWCTLAVLLFAGSASAAVSNSGLLAGTSTSIYLRVTDQLGWSCSIPPGLVGTVRVQESLDDGRTWTDTPAGVAFLAVSSANTALSGPVSGGVTAMQAIVTTWISGSTVATLRATASSGPPRATASGTLGALNDAVTIPVDPSRWATVNSTSIWGGGANFFNAPEVSLDGGVNWIYAPYSIRTDVVSANPTTSQLLTGSGAAVSYSTPLPGNATHYRQRINGYTAGSSMVSLTPGRPLVPGVPVVAVLYDASEASIGAGINTSNPTFDVSGWNSLLIYARAPTTQPVVIQPVDDATGIALAGIGITVAATNSQMVGVGRGVGAGIAGATTTNGNSYALLSRRMIWYIAAGGTVTQGRIRVEAFR